jgi:hypothetical protein
MQGRCLCGGVRFEVEPVTYRGIQVCHCGQCRRWGAGPYMAVTAGGETRIVEGDTLAWYRSSTHGERGFCTRCGSVLFWRQPGAATGWEVSVNALDAEHDLDIEEHIWIEDKPGWYDFADDAPRRTAADILGEDR